ncbi:MAG: hypothetical protein ACFE96_12825 [Candidatus Hermodarchaeota archaeon]
MPLKLVRDERVNKIILYIVLIALLITCAFLIVMIINYYISLQDSGDG